MLKINMKPTGWFQIGWSGEIPPGSVKPMKYFGQDLVAFRSTEGELTVLNAHCKHLGVHLGYGGKVKKDCIVCPYHGWEWGLDGLNTKIPYQDEPTKARLRKWHIQERHGLIYMWHDPAGGPPRDDWALPDIFEHFGGHTGKEEDYYPCYPHAIVDKPDEPVHPQLIQENAADSMHFRYTHGAPEDPELMWFETEGVYWRSTMGFKSVRTKEIALKLHTQNSGVGLSFAVFDGPKRFQHYRLILTATPIDDDLSYLRVSYFFPREATSPDVMPQDVRDFAAHTEELYEEDARLWRHQIFVQHPVFARRDVAGYSTLRKWCEQFYELEAGKSPTRYVETLDENL